MGQRFLAVHRTVVCVDVERFADPDRTRLYQLAVRDGLYRALSIAFMRAGIDWQGCYREDRGDGALILVPPQVPKSRLAVDLPAELTVALAEHNRGHDRRARIRLRLAVHAGEVCHDDHGVAGAAINLAFRLLEAEPLRWALGGSAGVLAVIASEGFYEKVIRHDPASAPASYRRVPIAVKETNTTAWICLPDDPYPPEQDAALPLPPATAPTAVPRQLPGAGAGFAGRTAELAMLDELLRESGGPGGSVVISAIAGAGGIGKTWLALQWGHQHADRFPDGQLFVDLRGFSPSSQPMRAHDAVADLLGALGVDPAALPADLAGRAALYRTLLAGRQMLIVLDNARDAAHVRPLLPGSPTCTTIVTSRNRLAGLAVTHGARSLVLDTLDQSQALALLTHRLGTPRVQAEPEATAELLIGCGGLPLALGIIAARATSHPRLPLAALADELRHTATRLDAFDNDGDPATSLQTVLSCSYATMTARQAEVLGLLALAPGPDISATAVAGLTAASLPQTHAVLEALERTSLIDQHLPGRYRMHDLIGLYAARRADRDQPEHSTQTALRRLVDHYAHTAHTGDRLLDPHGAPITFAPPLPGCRPHPLTDERNALAWFTAERHCLATALQLALDRGWHSAVWQLAWNLDTYLFRHGDVEDYLAVWRAGLTAADHLHDPANQARAHRRLGTAHARAGRHDHAIDHLQQALTLAENSADRLDQARTHYALVTAWEQQHDHQQALAHATRALHLFQTLDAPVWQARALTLAGRSSAKLGHHRQADTYCHAALTLFRRHHDFEGQADTLTTLASNAHHTGQHDQALELYRQALTLCRDHGYPYRQADILDGLGHTHTALGNHHQAHHAWKQALHLYQSQHRTTNANHTSQHLITLDTP